jgi:5-(carboxyamino)imidazole ribonucleotide synthase
MLNLLGVSYEEIDWKRVLSVEGTKLYWYGKEKKQRRKMGHINLVASTEEEVMEKLNQLYDMIYEPIKC